MAAKPRLIAGVGIALIATLAVGACGSSGSAADRSNSASSSQQGDQTGSGSGDPGSTTPSAEPTDKTGPLTKVIETVTDKSLAATAAWQTSVPQKLGYFEQEGLEVTVQPAQNGIAMVQAGQALIAQASAADLYRFNGPDKDDLVGVYVNHAHSFRVTALKDTGIAELTDLEGKTIGSNTLTDSMYVYARAAIESAGMDPDKDVKWLPVGVGAQAAAAYEKQQVEAYAGADYYNKLIGHILDKGIVELSSPADEFSGFGGWVVQNQTFESQSEIVAGFIRATQKGMVFTYNNPKAAVQIHWEMNPATRPSDWNEPGTLDFWADVVKLRLELAYGAGSAETMDGQPTKDAIEQGIDFQVTNKMLTEKPDFESAFDFSLIDAINDFDHAEIAAQAQSYSAG